MVFSSYKTVVLVATTFLLSSSAVTSLPTTATSDFGRTLENIKSTLQQRQDQYVSTIGIKEGLGPANGQVPLRVDIIEMAKDKTKMNLFYLAMDKWQTTSEDDKLSYYQIAGIHGRPFVSWDGVKDNQGRTDMGYCTHIDILFATWHRPYLALYEQIVWKFVQQIAGEFPAGSPERAAAPSFRVPYWDWARDTTVPDFIASMPQIDVTTPSGTVQKIHNPLYSYRFQKPVSAAAFPRAPFDTAQETIRFPKNGVNDPATMNGGLKNLGGNLKERAWTLLLKVTDFGEFSTKATQNTPDSLEALHDVIHANVGGNDGHMAYIDYAAFDPIFFLHHTNIDRMYAIWQAINPGDHAVNGRSEYGTFSLNPGVSESKDTPLMPFRTDQTTWWTSEKQMNVKSFGYTYPEIVDWNIASNNLSAVAIAAVNNLYGKDLPNGALNAAVSSNAVSTTRITSVTSSAVPTTSSSSSISSVIISSSARSTTVLISTSSVPSSTSSITSTTSFVISTPSSSTATMSSSTVAVSTVSSSPAVSIVSSSSSSIPQSSTATSTSASSSKISASVTSLNEEVSISNAIVATVSTGSVLSSSTASTSTVSVSSIATSLSTTVSSTSTTAMVSASTPYTGTSLVSASPAVASITQVEQETIDQSTDQQSSPESGNDTSPFNIGTIIHNATETIESVTTHVGEVVQSMTSDANDCALWSGCFWDNLWWQWFKHARPAGLGPATDHKNIIENVIEEVKQDIVMFVDAIPPIKDIVPHTKKLVVDNHYNEWVANVEVMNSAGNGTFGIYLFLGDVSSDPDTWATNPSLIGSHSIFVLSDGPMHDFLVSGTVPLTSTLLNRVVVGQIDTMDASDVLPFLKKSLRWGVKNAEDQIFPNEDVNGLKVTIVSSKVKLACDSNQLPVWGAETVHTL